MTDALSGWKARRGAPRRCPDGPCALGRRRHRRRRCRHRRRRQPQSPVPPGNGRRAAVVVVGRRRRPKIGGRSAAAPLVAGGAASAPLVAGGWCLYGAHSFLRSFVSLFCGLKFAACRFSLRFFVELVSSTVGSMSLMHFLWHFGPHLRVRSTRPHVLDDVPLQAVVLRSAGNPGTRRLQPLDLRLPRIGVLSPVWCAVPDQ